MARELGAITHEESIILNTETVVNLIYVNSKFLVGGMVKPSIQNKGGEHT